MSQNYELFEHIQRIFWLETALNHFQEPEDATQTNEQRDWFVKIFVYDMLARKLIEYLSIQSKW